MSDIFTIHYKVEFVSGILEGLVTSLSVEYPMSSLEKVKSDMESDIEIGRVIDPSPHGSSKYYIISYWIES